MGVRKFKAYCAEEKIQFVHVVDEEGKSIYKKQLYEEIADNNITKSRKYCSKKWCSSSKGLDDGNISDYPEEKLQLDTL